MEDSDSGGLISTEDDPSEESSGSTGHAHMEKKISKLKLKLRGFQNVSKNLSPQKKAQNQTFNYVNIDLRHQFGISVAMVQTSLLTNHP